MNHFESRMIGGINSSMQNRITLVDQRFIYKALGSFVADAHHPDRPSDRSAERLQTQILLEIFRRPTRHFMMCQNFCEMDSVAADWFFAGRKVGATTRVSWLRAALPVELVRIAT